MAGGRNIEPSSVWDRPEPPRRLSPSLLTRARIVAAAVELADADGLDAVSLRKVGAALDAGPMRLYGYVADKGELLDLMTESVLGEVLAGVSLPEPWREALHVLAARTRAAALRHEWFTDLLGGRPQLGPGGLAVTEATLAALARRPGAGGPASLRAGAAAYRAYVTGALLREVSELRATRASGLGKDAWRDVHAPYLKRALASGAYPTLAGVVTGGPGQEMDPTPEQDFTTGLDALLDGLAGPAPVA